MKTAIRLIILSANVTRFYYKMLLKAIKSDSIFWPKYLPNTESIHGEPTN